MRSHCQNDRRGGLATMTQLSAVPAMVTSPPPPGAGQSRLRLPAISD
jgi:hypothetical protein